MVNVLIASGAVLLALLAFEFGGRRLYSYALTATHLEVRLFGRFPICRIALLDMEDAVWWRASLADAAAAFTTVRIGNRVFGQAIVIRLRRRFPRRLVFTPDRPAEVLARLHAGIAAGLRRADAVDGNGPLC